MTQLVRAADSPRAGALPAAVQLVDNALDQRLLDVRRVGQVELLDARGGREHHRIVAENRKRHLAVGAR